MCLNGGSELSPNIKQNDRADDRHNKTGRMKGGTGRWFRKESCDQTSNNGTADAEQACENEAEVFGARQNFLCNPTDDETDNDGPDDM